MTFRRKIAATLLATGLLVAALAGCDGHGAAPHPPAASVAAPYRQAAVDPAGGDATLPTAASASSAPVVDTRALIRTATLNVSVSNTDDVERQAEAAARIAAAAGGVVFSEDRSDGSDSDATLVLKVPPAQLTPVLARLADLGVERSRQLGTQDVTGAVADVDARLASARASLARLQQLFAQARAVTDVLAVENTLAAREAALEALEAQQRALAAQTTYATITLSLSPPAAARAPASRRGFVGGLLAGWRHFVSAAQTVATAMGAAVPFAALLTGLVAPLWVLRRRRAGRQHEPV